jgi:hypothetical protein
MKSMDQTSLIDVGTDNGSGFSLVSRFFGLIRKFNSSSRYELPSIFRLPTGGFYAACFS